MILFRQIYWSICINGNRIGLVKNTFTTLAYFRYRIVPINVLYIVCYMFSFKDGNCAWNAQAEFIQWNWTLISLNLSIYKSHMLMPIVPAPTPSTFALITVCHRISQLWGTTQNMKRLNLEVGGVQYPVSKPKEIVNICDCCCCCCWAERRVCAMSSGRRRWQEATCSVQRAACGVRRATANCCCRVADADGGGCPPTPPTGRMKNNFRGAAAATTTAMLDL